MIVLNFFPYAYDLSSQVHYEPLRPRIVIPTFSLLSIVPTHNRHLIACISDATDPCVRTLYSGDNVLCKHKNKIEQ